MAKPLTNDQLERLLRFVGYGRLGAPVWFLGIEERGGDEYSLHRRSQFALVEDLKSAHEKMGQRAHHWGRRKCQPTWWRMCGIMLELEGRPNDPEGRRHYQSEELGRENGDTLLLDLLPIPNLSVMTWENADLLPQYENGRNEYEKRELPRRISYIQNLVSDHDPRVVICHGKRHKTDFEAIFVGMSFSDLPDVPEFAKLPIGRHWRIATNDQRVVLVTENFSRMNQVELSSSTIAGIIRANGYDRRVTK